MWRCYLTIFKAKAPIHIGYKQIGILKTTRYYITGRAMWGAITANLTRALFNSPNAGNYQKAGEFVKDSIRTTYFFPAFEKDKVKKPDEWSKVEVSNYLVFLPRYKEEGLKFGNISRERFEQTFIGSFVSTALESETKAAEEGSLHEFEFVKDKVRVNDDVADVYWTGYLFVKEGDEKNGFKVENCNDDDVIISGEKQVKVKLSEVLETTYVGGERNYGLGRLELQKFQLIENEDRLFGKFGVELDKDNPVIKANVADDNVAVDHLAIDHLELNNVIAGEIEPLVGLEWSNDEKKGAGQKVSRPIVCLTPGTRINFNNLATFVGEYGILISKN